MAQDLDKQLAAFLRKKRGEMSFAEFGKKTGLTKSTLFRLEQGEQSITLRRLHDILQRLKCSINDVFRDWGGREGKRLFLHLANGIKAIWSESIAPDLHMQLPLKQWPGPRYRNNS